MFIGHFGIAFAAKKLEPKVNLAWYFTAAQFIDLLWPVFVLLGLEFVSPMPEKVGANTLHFDSYPYTHSLVGMVGWALLLTGVFYYFNRSQKGALLIFLIALSHWFLDLIVHEADLPLLTNESTKMGLTLWRSLSLTIFLEFEVFLIGCYLYYKQKTWTSFWSLMTLVAVLSVIYLGSVFGPVPPPGTPGTTLAAPALLMWIFVIWGYFLDRKKS